MRTDNNLQFEDPDFLKQAHQLVQFYRDYPEIAANDLLNVKLSDVQKVVLRSMWFKNYVMAIMCRGSGKCVSGNTYLFTEQGIKKIKELSNELEILTNTDIIVSNGQSKFRAEKIYYDGIKTTNCFTTRAGFNITTTDAHPLLTLSINGNLQWKHSFDITENDYLVIERGSNVWGSKFIEPDYAYLLGLLIGDGCLSRKNIISFTNEDDDLLQTFQNLSERFLEYKPKINKPTNRTKNCVIYSKKIRQYLMEQGLECCLAPNKKIPKILLDANREAIIAFLQGLFDTDGGFYLPKNEISFCSSSYILAEMVHLLLLNLNIVSKLRFKKNNKANAWIIDIHGQDSKQFAETIGFRCIRKQKSLSVFLNKNIKFNTNFDTIPNQKERFRRMFNSVRQHKDLTTLQYRRSLSRYSGLHSCFPSYNSLNKILKFYPFKDKDYQFLNGLLKNNFYFDKVIKKTQRTEKVYDLVMPENSQHAFVGNGFINHNTFLNGLFACLKALLYPGYRIGLLAPTFRQCVVSDTLLITDKGFQYAEELKDNPKTILSKEGLKPCSHVFKNIAEKTIRIESTKGFEIEGAPDHKILILDENGNLIYKELRSVNDKDILCLMKGSKIFGSKVDINNYLPKMFFKENTPDCFIPSLLDTNLSYFLGLLTGDGCLTQNNYITFTNSDLDLIEKYKDISKIYFNSISYIRKQNNKFNVVKSSKKFFSFLNIIGLGGKYSYEKTIPKIILTSTKENICSYIKGLFDTGGECYLYRNMSHPYKIGYYSTSKKLIKELQIILLNLGIVASISKSTSQEKRTLFSLEISNKQSVVLFSKQIGFNSIRKNKILNEILIFINNTTVERTHSDVIPNINNYVKLVCGLIRKKKKGYGHLYLWKHFNKDNNIKSKHNLTRQYLIKLLNYCKKENIINKDIDYLSSLVYSNIIFENISAKCFGFNHTYDFTVDEAHNYFSNGFISHNSKYMFDECTRIWQRSPLLQNSTLRKPTHQSDNCYIQFKASVGKVGSVIQAIPLGDGRKIRGSRFFSIICDEFPHIPEEIFNMVIRPMAATVADPMENVERVARQRELFNRGLITKEEMENDGTANQIIITSSGYFTFNHMYKLYCIYKDEMQNGNDKYAVFRIPYQLLPEGFLDKDNIESAQREMSNLEFRMEYEAAFIQDTDGFYKASLIESCKSRVFTPQVAGDTGKSYILGIDPARTEDSFAICVAELGKPAKIVHALELQKQPFPRMATLIENLCDSFNVTKIYMDSQGGGYAIKDILAENNTSHRDGPILDPDDEIHQRKSGRFILKLCNFGTDFIADSNFCCLRLLEHKDLLFPAVPLSEDCTIAEQEAWDIIRRMQRQMQTIIMSETTTGKIHFDVPKGGGHGKEKKDLYTAFMLAGRCVYDLLWSEELPDDIIYHGGRIVRREDRNLSQTMDSTNQPMDLLMRDKLLLATDPEGYKEKLLKQNINRRTVITSPAAVLKPLPKKPRN